MDRRGHSGHRFRLAKYRLIRADRAPGSAPEARYARPGRGGTTGRDRTTRRKASGGGTKRPDEVTSRWDRAREDRATRPHRGAGRGARTAGPDETIRQRHRPTDEKKRPTPMRRPFLSRYRLCCAYPYFFSPPAASLAASAAPFAASAAPLAASAAPAAASLAAPAASLAASAAPFAASAAPLAASAAPAAASFGGSAAGAAAAGAASVFGASAFGGSAGAAGAAGASALGASAFGASSFLPQPARATANRAARRTEYFILFPLRVDNDWSKRISVTNELG
jgi:hypothetical protein